MIGFPIGVLAANAIEWYAHKKIRREYPRRFRESPFFSHTRHHKRVRLNAFIDHG